MKNLILLSLLTLSLVACKGGGSGSSGNTSGGTSGGNSGGNSGGVVTGPLTHEEVAQIFINELNQDVLYYDAELVKTTTLQEDYIVVKFNTGAGFYYDAIYIGDYNPDYDNASAHYESVITSVFFNLNYEASYVSSGSGTYIGDDVFGQAMYEYIPYGDIVPARYYDPISGVLFEKTESTPKDLAKMKAIVEEHTFNKTAEFLSSEMGLSMERSREVTRLAAHWKKAGIKSMTNTEHDAFATELLGFSITSAQEKLSTEGATGIEALVEQAAATNGITPEHASKLMTKVFGL